MATNPPKDNSRVGTVKNRSQVMNPAINRWVKRDTSTGKFLNVKSNNSKFKGVRKEK